MIDCRETLRMGLRKCKVWSAAATLISKKEYIEITEESKKKAYETLFQLRPDQNSTAIDSSKIIEELYDFHVIIPAYNDEQYIEQCIESVINLKTKYSYFTTVINDGSTDGTYELLKKYKGNRNIEIINQENKGSSAARNAGLSHIRGKYIFFLDADDKIGNIDKMMKIAIENDADIVQGNYCYTDESGKIKRLVRTKCGMINVSNLFGFSWGKLIKNEMMKNIIFPLGYFHQDSINAHLVFPCAKSIYGVDEICVYYRLNGKGVTSTSKSSSKCIDSFWITKKLLEERITLGIPITQEYYEYIILMVILTNRRTENMDISIKKSIFILWNDLFIKYFKNYFSKDNAKLDKAIRNGDYGFYDTYCKIYR